LRFPKYFGNSDRKKREENGRAGQSHKYSLIAIETSSNFFTFNPLFCPVLLLFELYIPHTKKIC
jgi:hypothetical protein